MYVDKTTVDKMLVDKMSVDKTTVDKMSVDKMSVDEMSVDKMSVDKMSVVKMTVYKMSLFLSIVLSFRPAEKATTVPKVSKPEVGVAGTGSIFAGNSHDIVGRPVITFNHNAGKCRFANFKFKMRSR
jgi:hypothetical protein